jgi:hypothetical protein
VPYSWFESEREVLRLHDDARLSKRRRPTSSARAPEEDPDEEY